MKRISFIGFLTLAIASLALLSFSKKGNQDKSEWIKDSLRVINYEPSVDKNTDLTLFQVDIKNYYSDASVESSWNAYRSINPAEAWQGPVSELIIIESGGKFNSVDKFEEGSIALVRINLFKTNPSKVLLEISKIDDENHIIELKYGKENITSGLQRISFISENGRTIINHTAYYKSKSEFRDKLYPRYHHKCTDEFHAKLHSFLLESAEK